MFWINFKYTLKSLSKNKSLLFWTYAFPIILGLLFNLAFQDLEKNESQTTTDIAIINNEAWKNDDFYPSVMEELSTGENPLFHIQYVSQKKADQLLKKKKISGYLLLEEGTFDVYVSSNGMEETILQYVAQELTSTKSMIVNIATKEVKKEIELGNYKIDAKDIEKKVRESLDTKVNSVDQTNTNMSYTMIEYYTLIAMACLYGGTISIHVMNGLSADITSQGKRLSMTPLKKGALILSSFCACYIVQIVGIAALFLFMLLMGNAKFGNDIGRVVLLAGTGSLAGLSLGIFVSTMLKMNEGNKNGILIALSMMGSFFSGMMGMTMKYIIDTNIPIINQLNPAAMITDGLYSLYYYNDVSKFNFDVMSLVIFSLVLLSISMIRARRVVYDSL